MIQENLQKVRESIRQAQARSSKAAQDVLLVAVSKTQPLTKLQEAVAAGQRVLGENRVQELLEKYQTLPDLDWHLIGHLQTNKVKYVVDKIALLHSLDSMELAQEIEKRAARIERRLPVLVQVNIAEEESKFGLKREEVADFLTAMADYPHLHVQGLMTVGPFWDEAEALRPIFQELRDIFEREKARKLPHVDLRHLSMGMSNDYLVAVEEGATMVRVGSSIFGPRTY